MFPNHTAGHGRKVCEFGVVHSNCRCMDNTTTWIQCPDPKTCEEKTGVDPKYVPKHRKAINPGRREVKIDP